MMVLVDTSIWSLALRRDPSHLSVEERYLTSSLRELIEGSRVQLIGAVRQEILTGIREQARFRRIRSELREFEDVALNSADYENAASMSNLCRQSGIAATPIDMLICAVSQVRGWNVFTADRDFAHYSKVLRIQLLTPFHAH
jgi:predicted nucleic acid-binding protein